MTRYGIIFGLLAALLTLGTYVLLDWAIAWPHAYLTWAAAISVVTFVYYALDKWLARAGRGRARVPEMLLNVLTVLGGVPGAWLGRGLLRHKTSLREHWLMLAILIVSSFLHVYVLHALYSGSLPLG